MPGAGAVAVEPPEDALDVLATTSLLRGASRDEVRALADVVDWWYLDAGTPLFEPGDDADGLYVVVDGRLESRADHHVLGEVARGGIIGESALVQRRRRTSSAHATRDSVVARLAPERLPRLAEASPRLSVDVGRRAARRLPDEPWPVRGRRPARAVAVLRLDGAGEVDPWARHLASRLADHGSVRVVPAHEWAHWARAGRARIAREISDAERRTEHVVLPVHADEATRTDTALLLRHVDVVVGVAHATRAPDRGALGLLTRDGAPVALALGHRAGRRPASTGRWLDDVARHADLRDHTHVRLVSGGERSDDADLDRLARLLRGRAVALVLGGGGSRGFAHIGAVRALQEAGVTIDRIGGSSMGAVIGAQVAAGWSADEMLERNTAAWSRGRLFEPTIPTLSLLRGRRARAILHRLFGEQQIEDLWLEFFCTTVDLSAYELDVHRRGSVRDWVGASSTVPGLWPPLVDGEGHLHVDGGMLDNVPTAVMRGGHAGPLVAIDVCHRQAALTVPPRSLLPAGLALLRQRLVGRWTPSILDVVGRANLLASLQQLGRSASHADLYVAPPVEDLGFLAFDRIRQLADIGYRTTVEALEAADRDLLTLAA